MRGIISPVCISRPSQHRELNGTPICAVHLKRITTMRHFRCQILNPIDFTALLIDSGF